MSDLLAPNVRNMVMGDQFATYAIFSYFQAFSPVRAACDHCGGVNAYGEPFDITCQYCDGGYTIAWMIQELRGRISDIALVTQLFVSITPGIEVGDKLLIVSEHDAPVLQAVQANERAYLKIDNRHWRPRSVQASQFGQLGEWVAALRKVTPEITYDEGLRTVGRSGGDTT